MSRAAGPSCAASTWSACARSAFLIGTVSAPLLVIGLMLVPGGDDEHQHGRPLRVAVLDASGSLRDARRGPGPAEMDGAARFVVETAEGGHRRRRGGAPEARRPVRPARRVPVPAGGRAGDARSAEYFGRNVSNVADLRLVDQAVEEVMVARRLAGRGWTPAT